MAVGDADCAQAGDILSRVDRALTLAITPTLLPQPDGPQDVSAAGATRTKAAGKASKKARLALAQPLIPTPDPNPAETPSPHAGAVQAAGDALAAALVLLHRSRALFEWRDGPLVTAMREGHVFVLDEVDSHPSPRPSPSPSPNLNHASITLFSP